MSADGNIKIEWKNLLGFDQIADRQRAIPQSRIGSKIGSPKPVMGPIGSKIGSPKPETMGRIGSKVGTVKN